MVKAKTKAPTKEKSESIVCPIIKVVGEKHLLEKLIASGEAPEMKAVGYMRIGKERNSWTSYTVTFKDNIVLKIEIDEPNLREIAEESAKIAFVENLISPAEQV